MKKVCEDDHALTVAFNFFNPKRQKKIKAKPTDISEFLKNGGQVKKCPTPEYTQNINSRYRQKEIDYEKMNRSRFSQKFKDKVEKKNDRQKA